VAGSGGRHAGSIAAKARRRRPAAGHSRREGATVHPERSRGASPTSDVTSCESSPEVSTVPGARRVPSASGQTSEDRQALAALRPRTCRPGPEVRRSAGTRRFDPHLPPRPRGQRIGRLSRRFDPHLPPRSGGQRIGRHSRRTCRLGPEVSGSAGTRGASTAPAASVQRSAERQTPRFDPHVPLNPEATKRRAPALLRPQLAASARNSAAEQALVALRQHDDASVRRSGKRQALTAFRSQLAALHASVGAGRQVRLPRVAGRAVGAVEQRGAVDDHVEH